VKSVEDMSAMFEGASSYNQPLGNWDVKSVNSMRGMFEGALSFNQPLGNWKHVMKHADKTSMFDGSGCPALEDSFRSCFYMNREYTVLPIACGRRYL
jgi:hypothetical protein